VLRNVCESPSAHVSARLSKSAYEEMAHPCRLADDILLPFLESISLSRSRDPCPGRRSRWNSHECHDGGHEV
jgi:hypothetical protein